MSALSRFEEFVENLVEGSFTRWMQSPLQPVELARRLEREMETQRAIGVGKVYVPNEYLVLLSPESFAQFEPFRSSLERELSEYLVGVARERDYVFLRRPTVTVESLSGLTKRQIQILSRLADFPKQAVESPESTFEIGHTHRLDAKRVREVIQSRVQKATLVIRGRKSARFDLDKSMVSIGRALDNDIVIEDSRVSRYHAEVRLIGSRYCLVDLKSTNGSRVNGKLVTQCALDPEDVISVGKSEIVFTLQAEPIPGVVEQEGAQ